MPRAPPTAGQFGVRGRLPRSRPAAGSAALSGQTRGKELVIRVGRLVRRRRFRHVDGGERADVSLAEGVAELASRAAGRSFPAVGAQCQEAARIFGLSRRDIAAGDLTLRPSFASHTSAARRAKSTPSALRALARESPSKSARGPPPRPRLSRAGPPLDFASNFRCYVVRDGFRRGELSEPRLRDHVGRFRRAPQAPARHHRRRGDPCRARPPSS